MKNYLVDIELDSIEIRVKAKNRTDARKKALAKLNRKSPASLIKRHFPTNRKVIWIDEI